MLIGFSLTGCSDNEGPNPVTEEIYDVTVTAQFSGMTSTKAYQETGDVKAGIYYLSYPQKSNNTYNLANVNFATQGVTPGIGIVTVPPDQALKWDLVAATPTFYLDNVDPGLSSGNDKMTVVFGNNNPFIAAPFDSIDGKNDLLWGTREVNTNTKTVNFDLHHNMARVKVLIQVDKTNENNPGDLDLTDAIVEITSINQVPLSYNRYDGTLALDLEDANAYQTLTLVDENLKWQKGWPITDTDNNNISYWLTGDFVVPPQELLGDANRPRLTISLKSGKVYSGILPYAMEIVDSEHSVPYPVTLSFLKEHILTIRTIVTERPPELAFMPVQVIDWVDKGTFSLDGHEAGIYTATEFYNLIRYYTDYNPAQLTRFGKLSDGNWIFNIWFSLTLDYSEIHGKMLLNSSAGFSFKDNGYTITIINNGEREPYTVSAGDLYKIVTGQI